MVDSVATVALETLRDLLIEETKFLLSVSGKVEEVRRQLTAMHDFLKDADKRKDINNSETVRHWVANLRNLSIEAENILERYVVEVTSRREGKNLKEKLKRFTCILSECLSVHQTGKDIEDIMSRMADLTKQAESMTKGDNSSKPVGNIDPRKTYGLDVGKHFVGMNEDIKLLESFLDSDNVSHQVISICGMGGLGKTTLATKLYKGVVAQRSFEARAWTCITQQCQPKSVFRAILKQLAPQEGAEQDHEDELVRQLYNVQKEKRCLVVLDDIWEVDHWNSLSRAFPTEETHSKVLLTTRNRNIASTEYVHELKCLEEDEGWELLQKIALPTNCPQEVTPNEIKQLEETGREIVRKCGCLPLPISVIGGHLRQEKTLIEWEKVCKNIDSYLHHGKGLEKDQRIAQILELSYNVLPYNLKPCFLYLGCFPEDEEIETEKLYLIWMAEGMISNEDRGRGETLRDVAEHYLFELASKCMVEVKMDEKSTSNRFESCRLHDMIRELCLSKAKDEEFFKVVDKPMGVDDEPSTCKTSRLAIHLDEREDDHIWKDQDLRSLLSVNNRRGRVKRCWNNLDLGMFKFLRILILEKHRFKNKKLPNGIGKLILLKYLSIKDSEVDELPKSVCKLLCLQSLDLRVESDFTLPNSIHKLRHLKHLFVNNVLRSVIGGKKLKLDGLNELETLIGFRSDIDETTHLLKLRKLQVLDAVVTDDQSLPMIVDHIFNHQDQFREVHLMILSNINSEQDSSLLRKVFMCRSLSELSIGHVSKLPAYELELGRNLIRLNLDSQCNIAKDPMAILEKLPMLRELIFREDSYVGREMVCRAAGFPQLKKLMLWELPNLEEWRVEEGAMPNLSFLDIHKCEKLEMIPDGLKSITTLQELSITWMSKKFVDRIKVVNGEEGEDYHKIKHIPSLHIW